MLPWLSKIKEKAMNYKEDLQCSNNQNEKCSNNQNKKRDLDGIRREYETWRRKRPNRGLIPDHLWESAVKLCRTHSINQVVKTLHLNYNALRTRVENNQSGNAHKKDKRKNRRKPRFIEVTASAAKYPFNSPPHNIIIEYQKIDGNNLKISIPQGIELNLQEMISSLAGEKES
jgi:hypothetical protein